MVYGRTSEHPLQVVVIGGGTSGCAVAYALIKAGHEVVVIDRKPTLDVGGMQHLGPNGLKVLYEWDDVGEELHEMGWTCHGIDFIRSDTEELLGRQPFHPELVRDAGAPAVYCTHDQLHQVLRSAARKAGCVFIQGPATDFDPTTNTVTLANGETAQGDLVVGADGSFSIVRRTLFPHNEVNAKKGRPCTIGFVSKEKLATIPGLERVVDDDFVPIWLGTDTYATACPKGDRKSYCFELHYPQPSSTENGNESDDEEDNVFMDMQSNWKPRPMTQEVRDAFSDYGPILTGILSLADTVYSATRYDLPVLELYHYPHDGTEEDSQHGSVLVGDAAHPSYPGAINGFSMCIEDAQVLGSLLSRYNPNQPLTTLPALLSTYTQIRNERIERIHFNEHGRYLHCSLPLSSPAAEERDESIRMMAKNDKYGGDATREDITAIWAYHASDAAEDWWTLWRAPFERSTAAGAGEVAHGNGNGVSFWSHSVVSSVTVEESVA